MTVPAAEAPASARLAPTAAVPTSESTAMPAGKTTTMPATETASTRGLPVPSPVGSPRRSSVEATRRSGKPGSVATEMSDRCTRPDDREAARQIAAMPPARPDRREGQDRRTDEKRKGGRCENDERRRRCDDDFGRRQDDDWRRRGRAEQRADWRRVDPRRGSSGNRRARCRDRRRRARPCPAAPSRSPAFAPVSRAWLKQPYRLRSARQSVFPRYSPAAAFAG